MSTNIFTRHPNEVKMNYSEHFCFAMMLARKMFAATFASLIHSVFPFLFVTYTSDTIKGLNRIFQERLNQSN